MTDVICNLHENVAVLTFFTNFFKNMENFFGGILLCFRFDAEKKPFVAVFQKTYSNMYTLENMYVLRGKKILPLKEVFFFFPEKIGFFDKIIFCKVFINF